MILWFALGVYVLWPIYIASMGLMSARDSGTIGPVTIALGYPVVITGLALDVFLNATVCSAIFMELPKEWTITHRLRRYKPFPDWRGQVARWIARHLLDPFDPSGTHV